MDFTTAQKVTKHSGNFCNKICCQVIPKIAQAGHIETGDQLSSDTSYSIPMELGG